MTSPQSKTAHSVIVNQLVLPYGNKQAFSFQLHQGEKLQLTGNNGCGKSTLLKVLLKQHQPRSGEVQLHQPSFYLDQNLSLLNLEKNLLENIGHFCPHLVETQARTLLAGIGFRKDKVYQQVKKLSGGERMKLTLLIVTRQPQQTLLLLDEPDNHLDISAKKMLADAIRQYSASVILISHDEHFVAATGISHQLSLN